MSPEPQKETEITAEMRRGALWQKRCTIYNLLERNQSLPSGRKLNNKQIAETAGCSVSLVKKIKRLFKTEPHLEPVHLCGKIPGRRPKVNGKLPMSVYICLIYAIHFAYPIDYGMPYDSWSAAAVDEFLQICEVFLPLKYIYNFLRAKGLNSKVGERNNPAKDQKAVNQFTGDTYYEICRAAKENGETILFADETSIQQVGSIRGYAFKGLRARVSYHQSNRHTSTSLLTFMGPDGTIETFDIELAFDAEKFCNCLKELKKKYPGQKFVIILDNCRVHLAKKVKSWLNHWKAGKNYFRFVYLPPYAPEINPVERFNSLLKCALRRYAFRKPAEVIEATRNFVRGFCTEAQKNPEKVINLFRDEDCRYSIEIYEKVAAEAANI